LRWEERFVVLHVFPLSGAFGNLERIVNSRSVRKRGFTIGVSGFTDAVRRRELFRNIDRLAVASGQRGKALKICAARGGSSTSQPAADKDPAAGVKPAGGGMIATRAVFDT
jgi:hypothetical protein